uniref:Uncharacterized protein n=2 Tax=Ciona intestinalis TaxID=7719 RepID=F7B716_CIOIN
MDACVTMYKLGHLGGLVDYAKNVAQFTRMEFLNLIQRCPNSSLMWSLCRPPAELTPDPQEQRDPNLPIYQLYALPLRVDQAIVSLISSSEVGKSVAVDVIDDLYQGVIVSEDVVTTETLFEVVYDETDGDLPPNDTDDWSCVIKFCSSNQLIDAALEIQASRIVKVAVTKSLQAIALDEKEEFDYYT